MKKDEDVLRNKRSVGRSSREKQLFIIYRSFKPLLLTPFISFKKCRNLNLFKFRHLFTTFFLFYLFERQKQI